MATSRQNEQFVASLLPNYPLDEAIDWIEANLEPTDVFSEEKLRAWALDNGFEEAA